MKKINIILPAFLVCLTLNFTSCTQKNPSPLSNKEIKGLINKHRYMSYQAAIYLEEEWMYYKEKEEKDNAPTIYERIKLNLPGYYFQNYKKEAETPIQFVLKNMQTFLANNDGYRLRWRNEDMYKNTVPAEAARGSATLYSRSNIMATSWWISNDASYIKLSNDMDFEGLAHGNIKIVSVDTLSKALDTYIVKYKIEKSIGHIVFQMSKADNLPKVIDFDSNEAFLHSVRDMFKIAPYEVTVAYFDYNDYFFLKEYKHMSFNPKNMWQIKKGDAAEILDKFVKGEYYTFCSDYEKKANEFSIYYWMQERDNVEIAFKELDKDFLDFFNLFVADKASQITRIKKPLFYHSGSKKRVFDDERELQEGWHFLDSEFFEEVDYFSTWYKSDDAVIFLTGPNFLNYLLFVFKKLDGKWCLYHYGEKFGTPGTLAE